MATPECKIDVRWPGKKKRMELDVDRLAPVVAVTSCLADTIRERILTRGEAADGGPFGEHVSKDTLQPIRKPGRLKKGETKRPIIGYRKKPRFMWVDPSRGFPVPKRYDRKTPGGKYLVELSDYLEDIHGDRRFRFAVTGKSWGGLKLAVSAKGRVRVGFTGSGPSLKDSRRTERNAVKMAMAQRRSPKEIMEPSDAEVREVLAALQVTGEGALQAAWDGQRQLAGGKNKARGKLSMRIVNGENPVR